GLDPAIHASGSVLASWIAGSSPAMTEWGEGERRCLTVKATKRKRPLTQTLGPDKTFRPPKIVIPGLDPGIHAGSLRACDVDCRVKPGNDAERNLTSARYRCTRRAAG